jgi:hypothetical protein
LGEFVAVGVGLAFGGFGSCAQVGAELIVAGLRESQRERSFDR